MPAENCNPEKEARWKVRMTRLLDEAFARSVGGQVDNLPIRRRPSIANILTLLTMAGAAALLWADNSANDARRDQRIITHEQRIESVEKRQHDDRSEIKSDISSMKQDIGKIQDSMQKLLGTVERINGKLEERDRVRAERGR